MYARERTGEGGVVLYVLSSVSLYACVCERLFPLSGYDSCVRSEMF